MVPTFTIDAQADPHLTKSSNGGFVVSWTSTTQDGSGDGILVRRFNASGVAQGGEILVNSYATFAQRRSAVAGIASGRFVAVWQSDEQDLSIWGVFGHRLGMGGFAILDVDGDGAELPLTDGLLVMRWLFGFTGTTLTSTWLASTASPATPRPSSPISTQPANLRRRRQRHEFAAHRRAIADALPVRLQRPDSGRG